MFAPWVEVRNHFEEGWDCAGERWVCLLGIPTRCWSHDLFLELCSSFSKVTEVIEVAGGPGAVLVVYAKLENCVVTKVLQFISMEFQGRRIPVRIMVDTAGIVFQLGVEKDRGNCVDPGQDSVSQHGR